MYFAVFVRQFNGDYAFGWFLLWKMTFCNTRTIRTFLFHITSSTTPILVYLNCIHRIPIVWVGGQNPEAISN